MGSSLIQTTKKAHQTVKSKWALLNKGEIMEFAIVFIDSDDGEKSASIKAISEHKAVELFAHIYGDFEIVEVSEM